MTEQLSEEEMKELEERQLAITLKYGDPNATNPDGEPIDPLGPAPEWVSFPIDPETGYRKNTTTGEYLDAQTGDLILMDNQAISEDSMDDIQNP